MFCISDMLSKEEFHLKQNVEPFIHYREKHTTFECITRENIEAVAAKVRRLPPRRSLDARAQEQWSVIKQTSIPIYLYIVLKHNHICSSCWSAW